MLRRMPWMRLHKGDDASATEIRFHALGENLRSPVQRALPHKDLCKWVERAVEFFSFYPIYYRTFIMLLLLVPICRSKFIPASIRMSRKETARDRHAPQ